MTEKTYNLNDICQAAVSQLDSFCTVNGLEGRIKADLVCIKCSSREVYEARRAYYEFDNRFIYQAPVSGRRIAVIGLKEAIKTSVGDITVLEIVDQKADNSQTDKLSHIAVVPVDISYHDLLTQLKEKGLQVHDVSRGDGYTACDIILSTGFSIRIEQEPLLDRIKATELL